MVSSLSFIPLCCQLSSAHTLHKQRPEQLRRIATNQVAVVGRMYGHTSTTARSTYPMDTPTPHIEPATIVAPKTGHPNKGYLPPESSPLHLGNIDNLVERYVDALNQTSELQLLLAQYDSPWHREQTQSHNGHHNHRHPSSYIVRPTGSQKEPRTRTPRHQQRQQAHAPHAPIKTPISKRNFHFFLCFVAFLRFL